MGICGTNWNVKLMMIHYDFHISELVEAYQYIIDMRKRYNETNGMEGHSLLQLTCLQELHFSLKKTIQFGVQCMTNWER